MKGLRFLTRLSQAAGVLFKGIGVDPAAWIRGLDLDERGRETNLSRPYARSVWVQRAIKKIAGPIAAVELEFTTDGETEIESPELSTFWERPAVGLSRAEFIETVCVWLKLAGETFWILDDSALVPYPEVGGVRAPMIVARPDRMRHLCQNGKLIGWQYRDGAGTMHALLPEQVIHLRYPNPYDDYRGLSEWDSAKLAAEADYAAGQFNRNLAEANGDQGVYVVAKGMVEEDQRLQITEQLRMKRAMQRAGKFVPTFLTGDIEVQDPKIKAPDGDFWAGRLNNRHEIFLAFGVPPSMADKMESYSIGSASDWFILIFETCIPTSMKIAGGIDEVNAKLFGGGQTALSRAAATIKARWDWDEHPVMQAVRRERLALADGLWGKGMSMRDINEYLALGIKDFAGWEVGYLPFSVAPADSMPSPTPTPQGPGFSESGNPSEADPYQEMLRALESKVSGLKPKAGLELPKCFEGCCNHARTDSTDETDKVPGPSAKEKAHWRSLMMKRLPTIRAFESKCSRLFFEATAEVIGNIESAGQKSAAVSRSAATDLMFDLGEFAARFQNSMRGLQTTALQTAGQQFFEEIGKDDPFKLAPKEVLDFLDQRDNKIKSIPQDVFDLIKDSLTEGIEAGETHAELTARVKAERRELTDTQATTIAMTEVGAAYGDGRHKAMRQSGIQWKRWLTSGNANVRMAHRLANGLTVAIDAAFVIANPKTGEVDSIQHPGDPEGAPWNVINCHCVELAQAEPKE